MNVCYVFIVDILYSVSSRFMFSSSNYSRCMFCIGGWCIVDSIYGIDYISSRLKVISRCSYRCLSFYGCMISVVIISLIVFSNVNMMMVLVG